MSIDLLKALIEKLDKKRYTAVIRYLSQNNKRMKIPGFSSLEKTPQGLILNTAKTNKSFRGALLDACSAIILDGESVDFSKSLTENKNAIAPDRWLGIAAAFLKLGDEQDTDELSKIISEYNSQPEESPKRLDNPPKEEAKSNDKEEKREEKFREKYLKAHTEVERLEALLVAQKNDLENAIAEAESLRKAVEGLSEENKRLLQIISDKDGEIKLLKNASIEVDETNTPTQPLKTQENVIRILAPNCKDILEKHVEKLYIKFDDVAAKTKEELLQQYDQIWVLPAVISFATNRKLNKWKKETEDRIVLFSSVSELLAYAKAMI